MVRIVKNLFSVSHAVVRQMVMAIRARRKPIEIKILFDFIAVLEAQKTQEDKTSRTSGKSSIRFIASEGIKIVAMLRPGVIYDRLYDNLIKTAERYLEQKGISLTGVDAIYKLNSHDKISIEIIETTPPTIAHVSGVLFRELFITVLYCKFVQSYAGDAFIFLGYPEKQKSYDTWIGVVDAFSLEFLTQAFQIKERRNLEELKSQKAQATITYDEPVLFFVHDEKLLRNEVLVKEVGSRFNEEKPSFVIYPIGKNNFGVIAMPMLSVTKVGFSRSRITNFLKELIGAMMGVIYAGRVAWAHRDLPNMK